MTIHPLLRQTAPANLRDVGGLTTVDGATIRTGVLYRGDAPQPGDPRSAEPVGLDPTLAWPPATVIDLRSAHELRDPHPLADVARIHSVPLGAELAPGRVAAIAAGEQGLTWAYRTLAADAGREIAHIVALLARSPGPILVHCTAGKDRTGLVIATALAALGVPRDQIVADYLRTNDNLAALWARLRAAGVPEPEHDALFGVDAVALEGVLDDLAGVPADGTSHAADVRRHLARAGADPADLRALAERLLAHG